MIDEMALTVVDLVEYQLPEAIRTPNNSQFIALLKHYYDWLIAVGQPTDFIQNILEYKDIDMTNPMFMQHLTTSLLDIVPTYTKADKTLLTKHLGDFLKAKGSTDSFKFIMNAIYGEEISMEWNSNKLFRPSSNEYTRDASLAIESSDPWTDVIGAKVIQTHPSPASALISKLTTTLIKGVNVNWISLDSKSVIGKFIPNGKVECVHNTVNRAWFRETYYYNPISFSNHSLIITAAAEEARPYTNLIIKQLNSTFRAVISSFVARQQETGRIRIELITMNETGTLVPSNQLYIFPVSLENTLYTNESIEYGTVSNAIVDVNITNPGALYVHGEPITFQGGSGELVDGYVAEVTTGGIDTININKSGYGYSVGDKLKVIDANAIGSSPSVVVSSIDGVNGEISAISELNTLSIINGGSGFFINDELEVSGGTVVARTAPIRLRVSSINSAWLFKGISITAGGNGYPIYSNIALINSSTFVKIVGFSATPKFNSVNGIASLVITSIPTISTASLLIIANGHGATATATIGSGAITGIVSTNVGVNYIDPVVRIVGNGVGAIAQANMTSGTITTFTIVRGGSGYTSATIIISERYGSGFAAIPLIQNPNTNSGSITGLTILSRGRYTGVPSCFNNMLKTKIGTGINASISMDMRLNSVSVVNNGQYYKTIATSVSGIGANAVLAPQLSDGVITSFNIVSGGSGYTFAYVYVVGGHGFVGTAIISNGVITGVTIVSGGSDYTSANVVNIVGNGVNASLNLNGTNNVSNGVISSVIILNGGNSYAYNTTISCPVSQIGAVSATLIPVISNGAIVSITSSGGSGYIETDLLNVVLNSGVPATLSTTVSGNGYIIGYYDRDVGTGYYSQSEVTPLSITTVGDGSGALFLPTLNDNGEFISVKVLYGGAGYTLLTTIVVTGGGGEGATLKPVIFNGKITDIIVINNGTDYKYGTSAIVIGDGSNAVITPIVETGITSVEIVNGGEYYDSNVTVNVTDITGTGADIRATVIDGVITSVNIFNKGTGYTNPVITLSGAGINAILTADAKRSISSLDITNKGFGYTYAELYIVGDGSNANYTLIFDKIGSIDSSTVSTSGSGITSTPRVAISDISNFGAVSGLNIISQGAGYQIPPLLVLEDKINIFGNIVASGTKFTSYGTSIGGIKKVMFNHNGAHYNDLPTPIFPVVAILNENSTFLAGETVIAKHGTARDIYQFNYITMESGDILALENGDTLLQDIDDMYFEVGISANVSEFDFDRNLIKFNMTSDMFSIATENGLTISTENEIDIVSQNSGAFDIGDVLVGLKTNSMATIKYSYRANGISVAGGNGWSAPTFSNDIGKLNNKQSIIADNDRYQDYAYVIKAGIALSDYEELLKSTVHPAGYAMFGDVQTHTMLDVDILNEIGYNSIAIMLYIISIYSMYQSGTEWTDVSTLYGDMTKFNYKYMPISNISSYQVQQVSNITFENYQEYVYAPILNLPISQWDIVNNGKILNNVKIAPNGSMTMVALSDRSAISISGFSNTINCNIGDIITFEMIIAAQVDNLTIPNISIGDSFINFDPSSGNYTASSDTVMDVILVAQYWLLRIKTVATSTSIVAQILPSFSYTISAGVSDISAIGQFEVSNIFVKNITGHISYTKKVLAVNSLYVPKKLFIAVAESQITIS